METMNKKLSTTAAIVLALMTCVTLLATLSACSDPSDEEKTTHKVNKILFVGNSFTYYNDIPELVAQIAAGANVTVTTQSVTQGSCTFTKWADATDPEGAKLAAALGAHSDYDAVVLQEHSTRPLTNYNAFLQGAKSLADEIAQTQKNCKIYLYSTWGYADAAETRGMTITQMEAQLRSAYQNAAKAIGAKVSPVGAAFSEVYLHHSSINLYYEADNKHPSYEGSFLSACVHVATILGVDPRKSTFNGTLDETTATLLKSVAYTIVFQS